MDDILQIEDQRNFLAAIKDRLAQHLGQLTWDRLAELASIEPRALKTYRMPVGSKNRRPLPSVARNALLSLLTKHEGGQSTPAFVPSASGERPAALALVVPALAALVIRQARAVLVDRRMVSGVDWRPGAPVGLNHEDRAAMALVSRACLSHGLSDWGSEIHDLLNVCSRPLGAWLDIPEVRDLGLLDACLVNADEGVPTVEAEEIAKGFQGMSIGIEEILFDKFIELLEKNPREALYEYYTRIREFVVRHPVCGETDFRGLRDDIPDMLMHCLQTQFYEPVPDGWTVDGKVQLCSCCGNAMRKGAAGVACRTSACVAAGPAAPGLLVDASGLWRLTRGLRQYWLEPGFDEVRLFDALVDAGQPARLYPMRDRVDIDVGEVGIDLKSYSSPELLGAKMRRDLGGLSHYRHKWLVVPDWRVRAVPNYIERLQIALEGRSQSVRCMTVGQVVKELCHA